MRLPIASFHVYWLSIRLQVAMSRRDFAFYGLRLKQRDNSGLLHLLQQGVLNIHCKYCVDRLQGKWRMPHCKPRNALAALLYSCCITCRVSGYFADICNTAETLLFTCS